MSKGRSVEGKCLICGAYGALTFEHIPPESAYNDKPIFIQDSDHLTNKNSYVFGKRMLNNKGFGSYTLCKPCNNSTGGWYGEAYCSFSRQGMKILHSKEHIGSVMGDYFIKPLNVFKQILTMFMSADKSGHLQSNLS
jgi:hypothetical protein